mmetsp:Transcript_47063/g.112032  ORF Transcript_47063/g.112032 Transcript_47063/m.112032 type:complete len:207 (-) Transcript_47063:2795-3415(-)
MSIWLLCCHGTWPRMLRTITSSGLTWASDVLHSHLLIDIASGNGIRCCHDRVSATKNDVGSTALQCSELRQQNGVRALELEIAFLRQLAASGQQRMVGSFWRALLRQYDHGSAGAVHNSRAVVAKKAPCVLLTGEGEEAHDAGEGEFVSHRLRVGAHKEPQCPQSRQVGDAAHCHCGEEVCIAVEPQEPAIVVGAESGVCLCGEVD